MVNAPSTTAIRSVSLIVGLEVHIELATRRKMFAGAPSPAHAEAHDAEPNTLVDPVVYALPGSLPVMNKAAVEMAMLVGLALGCRIASYTKWDRKGYFYPDLPKGYQISQYDLPLCAEGGVDLPATDAQGFPDFSKPTTRIGIIRAHLEEDAGKLLHEGPGGVRIEHSLVDENRAGTPLLEVVTAPDFTNSDDLVLFARMLRNICRFLGVTEGVMQKGHMRFEPNINCRLVLEDGSEVVTPVIEIKNLNSFKALKGAVEFELADQPRRWMADRRVMGRGSKVTRGWDDARGVTFVQREKEDAHDYRYFPDPDLAPVVVSDAWREEVRTRLPRLPMARLRGAMEEFGLAVKEATALVDERDVCVLFEGVISAMEQNGVARARAGKVAANLLLGVGQRLANERGVLASELGISAVSAGAIGTLREQGALSNASAESVFALLCGGAGGMGSGEDAAAALARVRAIAEREGLLIVRDDAAMERWVDAAIAANPVASAEVRAGKMPAAGKIIGDVMKAAAGKADAKAVRELVLKKLGS